MATKLPLPLPPPSNSGPGVDERRLWIGNLDRRITELQLVKLLQKYGAIESFNLLYHKAGPEAGLPRGYAFVTFKERESALNLREALDGKQLGQRTLSIQWAHDMDSGKDWLKKDVSSIPALRAGSKDTPKHDSSLSVSSKIRAIESKLKMMSELPQEEFHVSTKPSSSSNSQPIVRTNSNNRANDSSRLAPRSYRHQTAGRFRPYNRH